MHRVDVESAPPRADVLIGPQQVERARTRIEAPANEGTLRGGEGAIREGTRTDPLAPTTTDRDRPPANTGQINPKKPPAP